MESDLIIIFSDDNEEAREEVGAKLDKNAETSMISKPIFDRLRINYIPCEPAQVKDAKGTNHLIIGRVDLRWRKKDKHKSFSETFYIVESEVPYLVLRERAFAQGIQSSELELHKLGLNRQTAGIDRISFTNIEILHDLEI